MNGVLSVAHRLDNYLKKRMNDTDRFRGDIENAQKTYENVSTLNTGRFSEFSTAYAKSFYMLGKIYEEMGFKGKAIENYEKFLEIWKDADPGLPEIEDAKARLRKLQMS